MHTTQIVFNLLLALSVMGGLAAVVRLAFRLSATSRAETLHPSQPLPTQIFSKQHDLARAA